MERTRADAAHADEIAEAGRELLRGELTRMTAEIGELKSRLFDRVDRAAVIPGSPASQRQCF